MENPNAAGDAIVIEDLELEVRIGVPEAERVKPQRLTITIKMWPMTRFEDLHDEIDRAVNYAEVATVVKNFASKQTDKLIETLANEIAAKLLQTFPLRKVQIELKKFVLPDAKHVAVILAREQSTSA